jgi:hypothetical protein
MENSFAVLGRARDLRPDGPALDRLSIIDSMRGKGQIGKAFALFKLDVFCRDLFLEAKIFKTSGPVKPLLVEPSREIKQIG